jgi:FixJ family two-component response regulator
MEGSTQQPPPAGAATIRILDDDAQVLAYLLHVVQGQGYTVRGFQDPADFLNAGSGEEPACLIVDWQLGNKDGLEVIARAQQQWPKATTILVSGHVTVPVTVAAMRQGIAGVLQKPVRPEELSKEIKLVLSRAQSRAAEAEERAAARQRVASLSELELSILKLLVDGTPNKNIATQTNLAIRTVEKYRRIVFDKLNVDSAAEATRVWVLATLDD